MELCGELDRLHRRISMEGLDILVAEEGIERHAALDQSEDRRLLFFQGAATAFTFQSPPASLATFFWTAAGLPLWPATT